VPSSLMFIFSADLVSEINSPLFLLMCKLVRNKCSWSGAL
jgi:hypothetical protein